MRREVKKSCPGLAENAVGTMCFVWGENVHHHHISRMRRRGKLHAQIFNEAFAIRRTFKCRGYRRAVKHDGG